MHEKVDSVESQQVDSETIGNSTEESDWQDVFEKGVKGVAR